MIVQGVLAVALKPNSFSVVVVGLYVLLAVPFLQAGGALGAVTKTKDDQEIPRLVLAMGKLGRAFRVRFVATMILVVLGGVIFACAFGVGFSRMTHK
jgi:hypothetical protein